MDAATTTAEGNDTFECSIRSDVRLPDDFHEWPEPERAASDAAIARLLKENPGVSIASDTSESIDETHPRFPVGEEHKGKFYVIRTVKLDRPGHTSGDDLPEVVPAHDRLAAAQEKLKLEPGHERGIGSRYHALHPAHKAHLAAIEHLIEVEKEHAAAEAHLNAVHAKVQHAMAQVEVTEKASAEEQE